MLKYFPIYCLYTFIYIQAERHGGMALNISPGDPPQPSPRSPFTRAWPTFNQNDLNKSTRADSIDDNTKVPGYDNNLPTSSNDPHNRRGRTKRRNRRYTLSIFEKELEEAKRLIEAKVDPSHHGYDISATNTYDNNKAKLLNDNLDNRSSDTEPKAPYIPPRNDSPRPYSRPEKVYARYVQEGDRNLMLIYEPKETKSEIYYKQVGNKNVIVHLNLSSNLCQLIDPVNKGIIPLDSEGEVWLEIKRRSQLQSDDMSDVTSLSDNVFENHIHSGVRRENDYVANIPRNDSYVEGKIGRREPTENSDMGDISNEKYYEFDTPEDDEEPYNTISIKERGDSLMIKFEKWNQHGVLNPESLKDSPILSHDKVIDFLKNKGNDFDMSICDWEYEKEESVYSYISSNLALVEINEDYTEIPPDIQQYRRPRVKELEEREASTFGQSGDPCYDSPIEEHKADEGETEIYSRINKLGIRATNEKEIHRSISDPAKMRAPPVENKEMSKQKVVSRTSDPEKYLKKPGVPARPPKLPPKPDLSQHKWYHGKIEKYVAKERLKGKGHGSFLVRDSANSRDTAHQYTIEFIDGNAVKKLMIMKTKDKYHFKEYEDKTSEKNEVHIEKFDRVEYLIQTIMTNGLEVKDSTCNTWKNIKVKPVQHP
ncbi:uncharacterized protein LOC123546498 isoform X3 [Mercenaria mercenaria]|uniref:uncharacterized protein LOC123546498 isoform X3 n=1 Tax=Mercenaria mercenaria TaxID=6596 RepID=UPI00234F19BC|nr:uncharacterized protein LOC123546498 isoform X3 [Mercenaria mercenaria]